MPRFKKAKYIKILSRAEYDDMHATLEHLIAVGSKINYDAERRREFEEFEERMLSWEHSFPLDISRHRLDDHKEYPEDPLGNPSDDDRKVAASKSQQETAKKIGEKQTEGEAKGQSPSEPKSNQAAAERAWVFAEDIRIYGGSRGSNVKGFAKPPWPTRQYRNARLTYNSDQEWNIEHGDCIHPLAFQRARLSGRRGNIHWREEASNMDASMAGKNYYSHAAETFDGDQSTVNGKNLHGATTETALSTDQVPRGLLLRCWERAVHAASCNIRTPSKLTSNATSEGHVALPLRPDLSSDTSASAGRKRSRQDNATTENPFGGTMLGLAKDNESADQHFFALPMANARRRPDYVIDHESTAESIKATTVKCGSLDINLKRFTAFSNTCPVCLRDFGDLVSLRAHYYGKRNTNTGCCWKKIPDVHTDVVSKVMESHVQDQVDLFLGLIFERANAKMSTSSRSQGENEHSSRRLMDWYDILKFVEATIQDAHPMPSPNGRPHSPSIGSHPIFETLQTKLSQSFPVLLNPLIVQTVRQRLIDRYAQNPSVSVAEGQMYSYWESARAFFFRDLLIPATERRENMKIMDANLYSVT